MYEVCIYFVGGSFLLILIFSGFEYLYSSYDRVVRASASGAVDSGLVLNLVKPMTLKLLFTASLLVAQH